MLINDFINRLPGVKKSGNGYMGNCPAHEDAISSLSVSTGESGRILLKCFAGCKVEDIVSAMGIAMTDIMGNSVSKPTASKEIEATYDYRDENGTLLYQILRYASKGFVFRRPDVSGGWVYKREGVKIIPYNLSVLLDSKVIFIVEGEKDVDKLTEMNIPACCFPFGASAKKHIPGLAQYFKGKDVYILPDNDESGRSFASYVAKMFHSEAKFVKILDLLTINPELPEKGDISDLISINMLDAEDTISALEKLADSTPEYCPAAEVSKEKDSINTLESSKWADLVPLKQLEPLPQFPINVLSSLLREYILSLAESIQASVDLVASIVLGAFQIACRARYPVRLQNGHLERAGLYLLLIAQVSDRKSAVFARAMEPLNEFEAEYNESHKGDIEYSKSMLKQIQGRIASIEQLAIKAKDPDQRKSAENELRELTEELTMFETFELLRLYGTDVTPEKLTEMFKNQGETFALVSAEGGGIFENIGRYNDKGGLEIYLNAYSGDAIRIDRKNSESISISNPVLNIIAPCQPSVVDDLFSDRQKSGRGLLSRILFVNCSSRVGSRNPASEAIDERVASNYKNLCRKMLEADDSGELTFDEQAFDVYSSFFCEIEQHLTPDVGELSFMEGWAGKLPGQMTRIAGLLHCIEAFLKGQSPLDAPINSEITQSAVELARYYLAHAKAIYTEQAEPKVTNDATYLWKRLMGHASVNKRDLSRRIRKKGFNLDEALEELTKRGYVFVEKLKTGGRPSEMVYVNPNAK